MISIIIPVYNTQTTIARLLDSIIFQTYNDWEAICVNDGSTDKSLTILDEYASKDVRIKVLDKTNGGVSSARNVGLNIASGEWITFADADDWLEPNTFEKYIQAAEKYNADVVRAGYIRHYDNGATKFVVYDKDEIFTDLSRFFCSLERHEHYSWLWTMFIRRDCIDSIRFNEDINYCEDHLFSYECYFNCKRMAVIAYPAYHYVTHESGSLSTCLNPYVLKDVAEKEHVIKLRMVEGKDKKMQHTVDDCYRYHMHGIVSLLYRGPYSYSQRKWFAYNWIPIDNLKYKEERLFFNQHLPFFIKDTLLRLLYKIRNK